MKRKGHKGFTLMEMMVVVLILCVLAAIAYPLYTKSVAKSKVVEAVNLLEMLKTRQSQYQAKNGDYFTLIPDGMHFTNKQLKPEGSTTGDFEFYNTEGNYRKIGKGFTMTLNQGTDQNCAVVTYDRAGVFFQVASAYDRPEIGCTGSVCSSFGDIFGVGNVQEINAVCNCADKPSVNAEGCPLDYTNCTYLTNNCNGGNGDCADPKPADNPICSQIGDNCVCKTQKYTCTGGSWIQDGQTETSTPKPTKPAEDCASGDGERESIFNGVCTNSGWTEVWATGQCKCKDASKTLYADAAGVEKCGTKCTTDMCVDPMIRNTNNYKEQDGGCCKNKCQDAYCSGAHEVKLETPDAKGKCCGCAQEYEFDEALNKCVSITCPEGQCKNSEGECVTIENECAEGSVGSVETTVACVYGEIKDICVKAEEGSCPSLTKWEKKCVCRPGYCGDNCEHAYNLSGSETKEVLTDICERFQGNGQYCSTKGSENYEAKMISISNYEDGSWLSNLRSVCESYTGQTSLGNMSLIGCVLDDQNYPIPYPASGTYCVAHTFSGTCACDGSITYQKEMQQDRYEWDCTQEQITAEACENYKSSTVMEDCPFSGDASGGGCNDYKGKNCAIVGGSGSGANSLVKCTKCSCVLASAGEWLYWGETEPVLKCNFGVSTVTWQDLGVGACRERTDPTSLLYPDDCNGLEIISQKSDSMVTSLLDSKDIKKNCTVTDGVVKNQSANVSVCADEDPYCYLGSVQATCNCAYQ